MLRLSSPVTGEESGVSFDDTQIYRGVTKTLSLPDVRSHAHFTEDFHQRGSGVDEFDTRSSRVVTKTRPHVRALRVTSGTDAAVVVKAPASVIVSAKLGMTVARARGSAKMPAAIIRQPSLALECEAFCTCEAGYTFVAMNGGHIHKINARDSFFLGRRLAQSTYTLPSACLGLAASTDTLYVHSPSGTLHLFSHDILDNPQSTLTLAWLDHTWAMAIDFASPQGNQDVYFVRTTNGQLEIRTLQDDAAVRIAQGLAYDHLVASTSQIHAYHVARANIISVCLEHISNPKALVVVVANIGTREITSVTTVSAPDEGTVIALVHAAHYDAVDNATLMATPITNDDDDDAFFVKDRAYSNDTWLGNPTSKPFDVALAMHVRDSGVRIAPDMAYDGGANVFVQAGHVGGRWFTMGHVAEMKSIIEGDDSALPPWAPRAFTLQMSHANGMVRLASAHQQGNVYVYIAHKSAPLKRLRANGACDIQVGVGRRALHVTSDMPATFDGVSMGRMRRSPHSGLVALSSSMSQVYAVSRGMRCVTTRMRNVLFDQGVKITPNGKIVYGKLRAVHVFDALSGAKTTFDLPEQAQANAGGMIRVVCLTNSQIYYSVGAMLGCVQIRSGVHGPLVPTGLVCKEAVHLEDVNELLCLLVHKGVRETTRHHAIWTTVHLQSNGFPKANHPQKALARAMSVANLTCIPRCPPVVLQNTIVGARPGHMHLKGSIWSIRRDISIAGTDIDHFYTSAESMASAWYSSESYTGAALGNHVPSDTTQARLGDIPLAATVSIDHVFAHVYDSAALDTLVHFKGNEPFTLFIVARGQFVDELSSTVISYDSVRLNGHALSTGLKQSPKFTTSSSLAPDFSSAYGWDTDQGWEVRASSVNSLGLQDEWRAFTKATGRTDNFWMSDINGPSVTAENPQWLEIQYPKQTSIVSYSITSRNWTEFVRFPSRWRLQGSNDRNMWIDLEPTRDESSWSAGQTKTYEDNINVSHHAYTHYRLYIEDCKKTSSDPQNEAVCIGDWSLFTSVPRNRSDDFFVMTLKPTYARLNGGTIELTPSSEVSGAKLVSSSTQWSFRAKDGDHWGLAELVLFPFDVPLADVQAFERVLIHKYKEARHLPWSPDTSVSGMPAKPAYAAVSPADLMLYPQDLNLIACSPTHFIASANEYALPARYDENCVQVAKSTALRGRALDAEGDIVLFAKTTTAGLEYADESFTPISSVLATRNHHTYTISTGHRLHVDTANHALFSIGFDANVNYDEQQLISEGGMKPTDVFDRSNGVITSRVVLPGDTVTRGLCRRASMPHQISDWQNTAHAKVVPYGSFTAWIFQKSDNMPARFRTFIDGARPGPLGCTAHVSGQLVSPEDCTVFRTIHGDVVASFEVRCGAHFSIQDGAIRLVGDFDQAILGNLQIDRPGERISLSDGTVGEVHATALRTKHQYIHRGMSKSMILDVVDTPRGPLAILEKGTHRLFGARQFESVQRVSTHGHGHVPDFARVPTVSAVENIELHDEHGLLGYANIEFALGQVVSHEPVPLQGVTDVRVGHLVRHASVFSLNGEEAAQKTVMLTSEVGVRIEASAHFLNARVLSPFASPEGLFGYDTDIAPSGSHEFTATPEWRTLADGTIVALLDPGQVPWRTPDQLELGYTDLRVSVVDDDGRHERNGILSEAYVLHVDDPWSIEDVGKAVAIRSTFTSPATLPRSDMVMSIDVVIEWYVGSRIDVSLDGVVAGARVSLVASSLASGGNGVEVLPLIDKAIMMRGHATRLSGNAVLHVSNTGMNGIPSTLPDHVVNGLVDIRGTRVTSRSASPTMKTTKLHTISPFSDAVLHSEPLVFVRDEYGSTPYTTESLTDVPLGGFCMHFLVRMSPNANMGTLVALRDILTVRAGAQEDGLVVRAKWHHGQHAGSVTLPKERASGNDNAICIDLFVAPGLASEPYTMHIALNGVTASVQAPTELGNYVRVGYADICIGSAHSNESDFYIGSLVDVAIYNAPGLQAWLRVVNSRYSVAAGVPDASLANPSVRMPRLARRMPRLVARRLRSVGIFSDAMSSFTGTHLVHVLGAAPLQGQMVKCIGQASHPSVSQTSPIVTLCHRGDVPFGIYYKFDPTRGMHLVISVGECSVLVHASLQFSAGDLLVCGQDGIAERQADDIVRSTTIGKCTQSVGATAMCETRLLGVTLYL